MSNLLLQLILSARDGLSGPVSEADKTMKKLEDRFKSLKDRADKVGDVGRRMAFGGAAITAVSGATVKAYADLEAAQARLENALGTSYGPNPLLGDLKKIVVDLGNRYPGSTETFTNLAEAMLKSGMSADTLASGALKGAAALQVMFGLDPAEGGKQFVQMGNALGIAGKDATQFADVIQRLSYASGLTLQEIATAMPYMGEKLKMMGVQGLDKAKEVAAVMGALKKQGVEGSMLGTTFEQFLTRTAMISPREKFARGGLKVEMFQMLRDEGIKLDFFDKDGNFRGIYQAVGELSKLNKLSQEKKLLVMNQLFGETGARMAAVDLTAVRSMAQRMLVQEDIQKRLDRITATLAGRWEAAKGTFINLMATIGERLAPTIGPLLDKINAMLTRWQEWSEAHPKLVTAIVSLVTALGLLLTAGGGALWFASKIVTAYTTMVPVFAWIGSFVMGTLVPALSALGTAIAGILEATPIGWIITGIVAVVAAGVLLYKNWDRIVGWLRATFPAAFEVAGKVWQQLKDALGQAWSALKDAGGALMEAFGKLWVALAPVRAAFMELWERVKPLVVMLGKAGLISALLPLGVALGVLLGGLLLVAKVVTVMVQDFTRWMEIGKKVITWLGNLSAQLVGSGAALVKGLADGILKGADLAVDAIKKVVTKVRRFLPFSPAKEGPLMDIHRIKLVETIADSLNPAALVARMRGIAGAVMASGPARGAALGLVATAGHAGIQITIQVDARGAQPGMEKNIKQAVLDAAPALKKELDRLYARENRGSF